MAISLRILYKYALPPLKFVKGAPEIYRRCPCKFVNLPLSKKKILVASNSGCICRELIAFNE